MPFRCAHGPWIDNREPSLDEMLADPLVRLTMASYGASEAEIRQLVGEAQNRLMAALQEQVRDGSAAAALGRSGSGKLH